MTKIKSVAILAFFSYVAIASNYKLSCHKKNCKASPGFETQRYSKNRVSDRPLDIKGVA